MRNGHPFSSDGGSTESPPESRRMSRFPSSRLSPRSSGVAEWTPRSPTRSWRARHFPALDSPDSLPRTFAGTLHRYRVNLATHTRRNPTPSEGVELPPLSRPPWGHSRPVSLCNTAPRECDRSIIGALLWHPKRQQEDCMTLVRYTFGRPRPHLAETLGSTGGRFEVRCRLKDKARCIPRSETPRAPRLARSTQEP